MNVLLDHPHLVTVWEAGEIIGFPKGTTKKMLDEKRFPLQIEKFGRRRVCLRSDAEAWVLKKLFGRGDEPQPAPAKSMAAIEETEPVRKLRGRPRKVAPAASE